MRRVRYVLYLLTSVLVLGCVGCGPRMNITRAIKPYEQKMPNMPPEGVPTAGKLDSFTAQQAKLTSNPAPDNTQNRDNGRIYYGYYCVPCHGADGMGNGPVGQSYVPKPTDLTSARVTGMTDGQLYRAMLYGTGHSPVLDQTVLVEHRWPLVLYVRSFGQNAQQQTPGR